MAPDIVTMFGTPPYRIDLLSDLTGVSFEEVWAGSVPVVIQGQALRVIGLAELRANKAATGREEDRRDIEELARSAACDISSPSPTPTPPLPRTATQ